MEDKYVALFTVAAGLFAIAAALFNWDFFFESRRAKFFVKILSRSGARIFYGILGLILFYLSYQIYTGA